MQKRREPEIIKNLKVCKTYMYLASKNKKINNQAKPVLVAEPTRRQKMTNWVCFRNIWRSFNPSFW